MKDSGGPYLGMAVFCERTLEEKDGVMSIIRVIDRLTISVRGPEVPDSMPPGQVSLTAIVLLKAGRAKGRHKITIRPEKPSGDFLPPADTPVLLEGEDRGVNLVVQTSIQVDQEGLYWFSVILDDDQLLTRIPLRIVYHPVRSSSS
ncbi:MAG: hypothetical protein E6K79_09400 [Candidatus Eisenbacteria bacterium]|uniref:Uncharacterized protein n=1 Tax=Eiseniibacteriota bacterium TaxID=2212470 RepID=A0A538TJQ0_UNCEI|nr:MAG: hypothetical protein E6K79_09400 [Candidatus Eisenbacteria bacterium]